MSDPAVERWKQRGRTYLWRFPQDTRNFPGWNCTADREGCSSLLELLGLMRVARWSAKADVSLTNPPGEIIGMPGHPRDEKWRSPPRFTLSYPKDKVPDGFWQWTGDVNEPTLSVGASKITELISAFESVAKRVGDFCVHAEDQKLHGFDFPRMSIWFW